MILDAGWGEFHSAGMPGEWRVLKDGTLEIQPYGEEGEHYRWITARFALTREGRELRLFYKTKEGATYLKRPDLR